MLANINLDYDKLIFWGAIVAICVIPLICRISFKAWKTHRELELKHEMIARGMSVEDIERVLAAGGNTKDEGGFRQTFNFQKGTADTSPGK